MKSGHDRSMHTAGIASALREKLLKQRGVRLARDPVRTESLKMQARAFSFDNGLAAAATVKDGLAAMEDACGPGGLPGFESRSRGSGLLHGAQIHDLAMPREGAVRIRDGNAAFSASIRFFAPQLAASRVGAVNVVSLGADAMIDGKQFLLQDAAVPVSKYRIELLPHAGRSVSMESLADFELTGFLREAEALKGLPPDRAELLAVYRHVPIEVISRLRFVAESRIILYSIARKDFPASTRVHDMAAVRDSATQEVYLIPHRTRFRSVALN